MIVDTTFVIDLLKGDSAATAKAFALEKRGELLATTTISVFEVWQGLGKKTLREQFEKTLNFLNSINCLPFDFDSAIEAGEIERQLRESGQKIDPEDCMIAGVAIIHHERLLTRNVKHFARIKGIEMETY